MSVIIRRLTNYRAPISGVNKETHDDLQNKQSLLQTALAITEFPGGEAYNDLIFIALTLVDIALNHPRVGALPIQGVDVTLSVVSTLHELIPDINDVSERDFKYLMALSADIGLIYGLLCDTHHWVIQFLSSSIAHPHDTLQKRLQRCHEAFLRKALNFMSDPDLSSRKTRRETRERTDAYALDWEDVKTGQMRMNLPGFWDHTSQTVVRDQVVLVKTYPLTSVKDFRRDLEALRAHRHAHLPALFGHSAHNSSRPFIAVSTNAAISLYEHISQLGKNNPKSALGEVWRIFINLRHTSEYLYERGICVSDNDLHDALNAAVVELPGRVVLAPTFVEDSDCSELSRIEPEMLPHEIVMFFNNVFKDGSGRFSAEGHRFNLRPLEYALNQSPSAALHSSFAQINDIVAQKQVLARWRPGAGNMSDRSANVGTAPFLNANKQPIVGDIGRYSYTPEGELMFVTLTNVQTHLGGFELGASLGEELQRGLWRYRPRLQEDKLAWVRRIPPEIALDYLSAHGTQLAEDYDINPESLVLVTDVSVWLRFDAETDSELETESNNQYLFAQFDRQGCMLRCYWSEFPDPSDHQDLPNGIPLIHAPKTIEFAVLCVQIEDDEVRTQDDDALPLSFAIKESLGDVGYYVKDDGHHNFLHVVCNSVSDLMDMEFRAFEGSDCDFFNTRMFRSRLTPIPGGSSVCYSWTAMSSLGLPRELADVYLYQRISSDRTYPISFRTQCGIVSKMIYQLQLEIPPDWNGDSPTWLFVPLKEDGSPERILWSSSDTPLFDQALSTVNWSVKKYPQFTTLATYSNVARLPWEASRSPPLEPYGLESSFEGQRVGDVGYFTNAGEWIQLGRIEIPLGLPEIKDFDLREHNTCTQVSKHLWKSDIFNYPSTLSAQYEWLQSLSRTCVACLAVSITEFAEKYDVPPADVRLVTHVTITVLANVPFDPESDDVEDHTDWLGCVYVSFPPDGGCYAYWSTENHTVVNSQLLSKLDLESSSAVQLHGCSTRVSFGVQSASIDECQDSDVRSELGFRFDDTLAEESYVSQTQIRHQPTTNPCWLLSMALVVRRFLKPGSRGQINRRADAELQDQQSLLQGIIADQEISCAKICPELVYLTLTIINIALHNSIIAPIAMTASRVTTSIISALDRLIPDINNLSERDSKYLDALSTEIKTLQRLLSTAHLNVIRMLDGLIDSSPEYLEKQLHRSHEAFLRKASNFMVDPDLSARRIMRETNGATDAHVLTWGDIKLAKSLTHEEGFSGSFWNHTHRAIIRDKPVLVKTYSGESLRDFRRDLEALRALRHAHLPALFGHSGYRSSTPFIAVAADAFVPLHEFISSLAKEQPKQALGEIWKMFITFRYTAEYLFREDICRNWSDIRDTLGAAVMGPSGRVILAPSLAAEHRWLARKPSLTLADLPDVIRFFYQELLVDSPSRFPYWPPENVHLIDLEPLQHAVDRNPSVVLHSSFAQLSDLPSQKLALARWRPGIGKMSIRNVTSDVVRNPFRHSRKQPAVGDIGRFLDGPDGEPIFSSFTNVQIQLGGYELIPAGEKLRDGVWRVSGTPTMSERTMWERRILPEVALEYLSTHGRDLATRYDVHPEDLVFVTEVSINLRYSPAIDEGHDSFLFAHFDQQGRLLTYYESSSPSAQYHVSLAPYGFRELLALEGVTVDISRVQIEEDELRDESALDLPSPFATQASLGDVGYYAYDMDDRHLFYILGNSASDLTDPVIQPLEANDCEPFGANGIWRSKPLRAEALLSICYSWKAVAEIGLPKELENIYLHKHLAFNHGYQVSTRTGSGIVDKVTYQLHVAIPSGFLEDVPIWLFIHLRADGRPEEVFWSNVESPIEPLQQALPHKFWKLREFAELRRQVKPSAMGSASNRPTAWPHEIGNRFEGLKVGDVGYWERDSSGILTDRWLGLGRVALPAISPTYNHSESPQDGLYTQVSQYLWQSDLAARLSSQFPSGNWQQALPCMSLASIFAETTRRIVEGNDIPQDEILLVTEVTTTVLATANPRVHRWAQAYVSFPPEGGCYAYWAKEQHGIINPRALAKLDLNDIMPGFKTQTSFKVDRISLDELSRLVEESPRGCVCSLLTTDNDCELRE